MIESQIYKHVQHFLNIDFISLFFCNKIYLPVILLPDKKVIASSFQFHKNNSKEQYEIANIQKKTMHK